MVDAVDWIALALAAIPCLAWIGILRAHYLTLRIGTQRVQVLTTRIALFLPTYAILLWISFVVPNLFGIMEAPIAIAEGHPLSVSLSLSLPLSVPVSLSCFHLLAQVSLSMVSSR
jgi:hypothetical protein